MLLSELVKLAEDVLAADGNLEIRIDGAAVATCEVVPGIPGAAAYLDLTGR